MPRSFTSRWSRTGFPVRFRPAFLEPIDAVTITTPDACRGDILGDLGGRWGQNLGAEPGDVTGTTVVQALVPRAELHRTRVT